MQNLTLEELADRVAPGWCHAYREAVGVRDLGVPPPAAWSADIAAGEKAYIESKLAERLDRFDSSDLVAAGPILGITQGQHLVLWKSTTPDWRQKIAKIRERRGEYIEDHLAQLRRDAPTVVPKSLAEAKLKAMGQEIDMLLRVVLTAPGAGIRADPGGNPVERRNIDRAEVMEATFEVLANRLRIGGIVFERVHVELAVDVVGSVSEATMEPKPLSKLQDRFDLEKRQRMAAGTEDHDYDAMTMWARHTMKVDSKTADALWASRSPEFPRRGGRPKLTVTPLKKRKSG